MTSEDFTPEKQLEYMDELVMELMQNGKDINEVLDWPFYYIVELLRKQNEPKQETSLIAAFGG
ncbi:phage tail assembly chaperone GT [Alkalihalobacillus sp. NPDC078783]